MRTRDRALLPRATRIWLLVLAGWTVPGLISTAIFYLARMEQERPMTFGRALLFMLPFWYLWAVLTPVAVWLARRLPTDGPRRWRNVAIHVGLAAAFATLHLIAGTALIRTFAGHPPDWSYWNQLNYFLRSYFEFDVVIYGAVIGSSYAYEYYRRSRRSALREAELEVQLANAHLRALKMQLQPHFLFNTLHAVSALMEEDVRRARRMLARLSELLRLTLDTQGVNEVPLEQELEVLELYLEIERERFSDRLAVEFDIEPAALDAMVPNLILQPLVENAVRHGIAPRPDGGRVTVSARRDGDRLLIEVTDDGAGVGTGPGTAPPSGSGPPRTGVGLGNARARLEELYGPVHEFRSGPRAAGGFAVRLAIPFRRAERPSRLATEVA